MALNAIYDKLDDVPEHFHELYTEKNGKFELTGITGVKTQADFDRVHSGLTKERNDHKEAKAKLLQWGDLKYEEVRTQLDEIESLRARAEAGNDPAKNQAAIDAGIKIKTAPMERDLAKAREELAAAQKLIGEFQTEKRTRTIHDEVRRERIADKARDSAEEDILLLAERMFEVNDEGKVVTKDGVGVTPGIDAKTWFMEMKPKKPHWYEASEGGGARGGNGGATPKNPWSASDWNITHQFEYRTKYGNERADAAARAAGSVNGQRPLPKAS